MNISIKGERESDSTQNALKFPVNTVFRCSDGHLYIRCCDGCVRMNDECLAVFSEEEMKGGFCETFEAVTCVPADVDLIVRKK